MKPELNRKYNTIALYVLIVAVILVTYILAIIYWDNVKALTESALTTLSPFIYGFAIAYILNPLYCMITNNFKSLFTFKNKRKVSPKLIKAISIICTYILALTFLALFFYIIIPQLWQSFQKLMDSFPGYIDAAENLFSEIMADIPVLSSEVTSQFLETTEGGIVSWLETIYKTFTEYTPKIFSVITGFATHVWNFVLGFIISIYMLCDKEKFAKQFKKLIFASFKQNKAQDILSGTKKIHSTFGGFLNGKILDSLIIGVICFIGMSILGIPYSPLVSVVVGVTNVNPYFGPFLGAIPSAFIILLEDPIKAIWFGIFIFVLQQLDGNFIGPKIIGEKIGLSSFWVIFALLIMSSLLGIAGLLLAVPIFALVYEFVNYLCTKSLKNKGYNPETLKKEDYTKSETDTAAN